MHARSLSIDPFTNKEGEHENTLNSDHNLRRAGPDHDAGLAETYSKGIVEKVDAKAGKVTIIHEDLVDMEMPAMTMVFRADEDMTAKVSKCDEIEFVYDRVEGKLKVAALQ